MSWLLFLDDSAHAPTAQPYEVRGGIAVHESRLWELALDLEKRELAAFGAELHRFQKSLQGNELLRQDRFEWASQAGPMPAEERHELCRAFLAKSVENVTPLQAEFSAFGQACLELATGIFESLQHHDAQLLAAVVPEGTSTNSSASSLLRKDHTFLLERFFYLLESEDQHGLIVMDEGAKAGDQHFIAQLQAYFRKTEAGRRRGSRIVPSPLFGSGELSRPLEAANLVNYCINWGFRLPGRGMTQEVRPEIAERFGSRIGQLQYHGHGHRDGSSFESYGIVFVPDASGARP